MSNFKMASGFVARWLEATNGQPMTLRLIRLAPDLEEFLNANYILARKEPDFSMFESEKVTEAQGNEGAAPSGPCMACGSLLNPARNVVMLDFRAPVPGTGWGCVQCGLPSDGALAMICDECAQDRAEIKEVFFGFASEGRRCSYAEAKGLGKFAHERESHPELWRCRECGCTADNSCEGGCAWVEMDLCSACDGVPLIIPAR